MIELHGRGGWIALRGATVPTIGESELFSFRGVRPGAVVEIGGAVTISADAAGHAEVVLRAEPLLRGHIGRIDVNVDDEFIGEVEVVPDKMSLDAYRVLRAELETLWAGLVLDPAGVSRLVAGPPPAAELWNRIEGSVRRILEEPHEVLTSGTGFRRFDRVRRSSELTPTVQRAGVLGRPARTRVLVRSVDTPENHLVGDTLRRLSAYATRSGDASTAESVRRCHVSPLFQNRPGVRRPPRYVLDPRYRRVQDVRRLLLRPDLEPVEGPGELRLGVQGLSRLYEYWVFLQILLQAQARFGDPVGPGFELLRVPLGNGSVRLEIAAGTTVTFPGGILVAFEPAIRVDQRRSWAGLELVPRPRSPQTLATPDVVIIQRSSRPCAIVVDAKYVARSMIETEAVHLHDKYGRMRLDGQPVVRDVVAVHPHASYRPAAWSGYSHLPMSPGGLITGVDLSVFQADEARRGPRLPERGIDTQIANAGDALREALQGAGGALLGPQAWDVVSSAAPDLVERNWVVGGFFKFVEIHVAGVDVIRNGSGGLVIADEHPSDARD